jgi:hypothetical protein
MLRVYLSEIGPALNAIDWTDLPTKAGRLGKELLLASCLKPLLEIPGRVELRVTVDAHGRVALPHALLTDCWRTGSGSSEPLDRVNAVLGIRRHLGWTVGLAIEPEPGTTLGQVMAVVRDLADRKADLAGPPFASVPIQPTGATNVIHLQAAPLPANWVVKIRRNANGLVLESARRLPDPNQPQLAAMFGPADLPGAPFTPLADADALRVLAGDGRLPLPQTLVLAAPDVTWAEALEALAPILERGRPMDLTMDR